MDVKHLGIGLVAFLAIGLFPWTAAGQDGPFQRIRTVVLDPGHGGEDPGSISACGVTEKAINLKLAWALRDALLERDPELVVLLTREDDRTLSLEERTHFANAAGADLFVSVHANGAPNPGAHGIETFFLAPDGTALGELVPGHRDAGPALARQEVGVGGDVLAVMLEDLRRDGAVRESARLAESVQRALVGATGARDRDVRSGTFRVLRGARMPAVVVEVGFLTNASEARRLRDPGYRERIVAGLVQGIESFDGWSASMIAEWNPPGDLRRPGARGVWQLAHGTGLR